MQNYIKWLSYEIYIYIYIYIYIVVGVLTMYDAWDIIVEIPLTCNQLKFNTCKANEPCMMTNPIDQDLDMQSPSSTSPLPWLSQTNRTSKNLSFPTGPCKIWILTSLLSLFLLRKVLGSSLESSLKSTGSHKKKKDKTPPKSLPLISFSWLPRQKSSSKKEASFNSLKLSTSHTFCSNH